MAHYLQQFEEHTPDRLSSAWMVAVLAALGLLTLSACSEQPAPEGSAAAAGESGRRLSVYVVNYPLQYFAERLGGPEVAVTLPVPSGVDPAFWKPSAEQIGEYQRADLILLNGASYAKWVAYASLPASRTVDTSAAFADDFLPAEGRIAHRHGDTGAHQHGDVAFTTWLDPLQAIAQAESVRDALIRLRPDAAATIRLRFADLERELRELHDGLSAAFRDANALPLAFSHPVYQYLIRRYGLEAFSLHWEPDAVPSASQWRNLEQALSKRPARLMVWEATPKASVVEALIERGMDSVVFATGANAPQGGDYLGLMRDNLRHITVASKP